jgi:hypothetical protein
MSRTAEYKRGKRNQSQEGLTAEYAKHAENALPSASVIFAGLSAYSAYSAVYSL